MKFTLSWLKDHLETGANIETIAATLTSIGLEVESISNPAEALKDFTVAKIVEAKRHPDADKLQICRVQANVGELQIICGAANARAGLFVALAQEGTFIPGGNFTIKKTKIRGQESNGMLCSYAELGIEGDSAGIIELPAAEIGSSVAVAIGIDDVVIDVAITPNRADCLGVRGIARDLAAAGIGTLKPLKKPHDFSASEKNSAAASAPKVTIATDNCQQFILCQISSLKNCESPQWLKKRLTAIGQKPISALVDITNYFTIDLARPLHVYDAKKLQGNITVRSAREGEKFKALNGKEYILADGMCVIADDRAVQAIGGIIGGEESGCSLETTDILLEAALFSPQHVATVGRALQIDSDARYRFERGVDVAFVEEGAKLAVSMITEICGGQAGQLVITGKTPNYERSIIFSPDYVQTIGGVEIPQERIEQILSSLGFLATSHNTLIPPSWRADVEGEADIVEELLRINGYDNIPVLPLPPAENASAVKLLEDRLTIAKKHLATRGYLEICSYSFLSHAKAKLFGGGADELMLANPIAEDLSTMRPCLLPNLLEAAIRNHHRGFKNLRLAEAGLAYRDSTPEGQQNIAAALLTGIISANHVQEQLFKTIERNIDAMDAKADALSLLGRLGIKKFELSATAPQWYHPGRSGTITLGSKIILAYFGELHPALLKEYALETPAAAFEIMLDNIPNPRLQSKAKPPLKISDYQEVKRDFAFVVGNEVTAASLVKAVENADKNLITDIKIFDVYSGKGIEEGKKSIALQVTLQSENHTLTDAEITAAAQAIISSVEKSTKATLRT